MRDLIEAGLNEPADAGAYGDCCWRRGRERPRFAPWLALIRTGRRLLTANLQQAMNWSGRFCTVSSMPRVDMLVVRSSRAQGVALRNASASGVRWPDGRMLQTVVMRCPGRAGSVAGAG